MLSIARITMTCFAASYAVALVLESLRLVFRRRVPSSVPVAVGAAGWLAHTLYLVAQVQTELVHRAIAPLSSWYDFCLLAAWVLAGVYLVLSLRRWESNLGLFLLPLVLGLIGLAALFRDVPPFPARTAFDVWRWVHGLALMLGTVTVTLGFATGLMYLLQAYRLKHKLPPGRGIRLPSLEWLQNFNRESLVFSTGLLALGLVSGVVLNLLSQSGRGAALQWTDPVVLSSGVLFLWLVAVTVFETLYRPARQGQKVAYLTLASFVFLGLAMYFVLFSAHASSSTRAAHSMAVLQAEAET